MSPKPRNNEAFTLLELMLSVTILAMVSMLTYMTFSSVTSAWKKGLVLSDELHHGDYIIEQLVTALRSSFYPDANNVAQGYGYVFEDEGSGENAGDTLSWVKIGSSLVGRDCPFAGTPHRVKVTLEQDKNGKSGIAVRAWRVTGEPDDFDPEQVKPFFLSGRVKGFDCKMVEPFPKSGKLELIEEWEETNRVPPGVEITLYMEPLEEGEKAIEIKRLVGIPVAPLSWRH